MRKDNLGNEDPLKLPKITTVTDSLRSGYFCDKISRAFTKKSTPFRLSPAFTAPNKISFLFSGSFINFREKDRSPSEKKININRIWDCFH